MVHLSRCRQVQSCAKMTRLPSRIVSRTYLPLFIEKAQGLSPTLLILSRCCFVPGLQRCHVCCQLRKMGLLWCIHMPDPSKPMRGNQCQFLTSRQPQSVIMLIPLVLQAGSRPSCEQHAPSQRKAQPKVQPPEASSPGRRGLLTMHRCPDASLNRFSIPSVFTQHSSNTTRVAYISHHGVKST